MRINNSNDKEFNEKISYCDRHMECDNTFSEDDFDDGGETSSAKEDENINPFSNVLGSPLSVTVSLDSQDSNASSSAKVLGYNCNGTGMLT